jgi:hemolysin activation/secretion protein
MKKLNFLVTSLVFIVTLSFVVVSLAQTPSSQTAGGVISQEKAIEKDKELQEKIEEPRPRPETGVSGEEIVSETGPTVTVTRIVVEGSTLLTQQEIDNVAAPFEGKQLTLRGLQQIADMITDEYRKKGYVTSRAYIPPQTIKDGIVVIRVVEGKMGDLSIQGNRHFKTSLFERKMRLNQGGYFDYSALQRSLVYINEAPDRNARVTLVPGKEPGTTDIIIEVEDRLPVHAGFEYDNFGSRYITHNRYAAVLEHNNLLGFDDKFYYKYQMSEGGHLKQHLGRYIFPLTESTSVGGYFLLSNLKLAYELEDLEARGEAKIYGLFADHWLVSKDDLDIRGTIGFDYKDIRNYLLGAQSSEDNVRMLKLGLDMDWNDPWGRNIILPEMDFGFPDIMGGMDKKDAGASRVGSGGRFTKALLTYYRLQKFPFEVTFLWKNSAQVSNYNLVASEQFQAGGAPSVRGYPPAEKSGDSGWYMSPEVSFPVYFLPKDAEVPLAKNVNWYDALRMVVFFDWATTRLNNPQPGEKKKETLKGWGFGWRFNVKDNLSMRVEIGYPLGQKTPSDADHAHPWIEFTAKF